MRGLVLALFLFVLASCRSEELQPLSEYETADLKASAYNFHVYPKAKFLSAQTDVLRKAHFAMQPGAKKAPPMAMYDSDAPIEAVGKFYAEKYGYGSVAESEVNNFSSLKPRAYYLRGNLAADSSAIKPILEKLKMTTDISKAFGEYRGAHISPRPPDLPRVTIQRPYFDLVSSTVVDRTLIIIVKE